MNCTRPTISKPFSPAITTISDPTCTPNSSGLDATLSFEIQVEVVDSVEVKNVEVVVVVNGQTSDIMPTEKLGSPTAGSGSKVHTYKWVANMAECGITYDVHAVATIFLETPAPSTTKSKTCVCT